MIATLIDGEVDLADILWALAVILFAVAAVPGLIPAGLACTAAALLVL